MKRLLKEFRIEIFALLAAIFGIFLLVEKIEIRPTVRRMVAEAITTSHSMGEMLLQSTEGYITHFTSSDLTGIILVFLALGFIFWRIRYRFMNSARWLDTACPRCQATLARTHRTRLDRWLGLGLLPHSRRYRCSNPDCSWSGLRYHHPHHRHLEEDSGFDQEPTT